MFPHYSIDPHIAGCRRTQSAFGVLHVDFPPDSAGMSDRFVEQFQISHCAQEDLIPHQPILLLFAASAQTHIFPEIRLDAIRLLKIFLEHMPHAVVEGWDGDSSGHAARILEGYLGFLNAGPKIRGADGMISSTNANTVLID